MVTASMTFFAAPAASAGPVIAQHAPLSHARTKGVTGTFSFVANFEDGTLDGFTSVTGTTPVVTASDYYGEPALMSDATSTTQTDMANTGFVGGAGLVSFQVAIDAGTGSGYFGLADVNNASVAVVGVSNGDVWAGSSTSSLTDLGAVPIGTAYPAGWVMIYANVYDTGKKTPNWIMDVYVDRTDMIAATVQVPSAAGYEEALITTTSGTALYTNIVVSTYEIPILVPGYNNMEGYGQGSGLLVQLTPAFTKLSAEMTLNSWDVPQTGILSFQINAMNYFGTTRSSCQGFFQLGVDLNPNGYIAPWYVNGKNCIAHYFLPSMNPTIQSGVASPAGTHLELTIEDQVAARQIVFTIIDTTIGQTFQASIPYHGSPFYGTYTQLEWQPSISNYPIEDYVFSGAVYNMQITTLSGEVQPLKSDYMLPFSLDAPPVWSLTYYQDDMNGYNQIA
jgi:hypothetical protein